MSQQAAAPQTAQASASAELMVEARHLVKRYHQKTAVNGVSFGIRRGEIFGVLGPNGAGKTTTLEMIEGIRAPDEGAAVIAGLDIRQHRRAIQRIIGVQLQATTLFPELTVRETIQFFGSVYPKAL